MHRKEVILTEAGLKNLEKELEILKSIRRREVAERIKQAREFGDISENSEYDEAKNEQAFIEGRIIMLEKMLRNAKVIRKENIDTETVNLGSTVRIEDLESGGFFEYTIVGSVEANPGENKISNESPVGRALLGRSKNDVVEVEVPAGILKFKIVDIINANSEEINAN